MTKKTLSIPIENLKKVSSYFKRVTKEDPDMKLSVSMSDAYPKQVLIGTNSRGKDAFAEFQFVDVDISSPKKIIVDLDNFESCETIPHRYKDLAVKVQDVIEIACAITENGKRYIARKDVEDSAMPREISTSDVVRNYFWGGMYDFLPASSFSSNPIKPKNVKYANKVLAFGLEIIGDDSKYLSQLRKIAESEWIHPKDIGCASSMVVAYNNAKNDKLSDKSDFVGIVGERVLFENLEIVLIKDLGEGPFGHRLLYKFRDANGNSLNWFSSSFKDLGEAGDKCSIKATIKEHTIYRGKKETLLSRCSKPPKAKKPKSKKVLAKESAEAKAELIRVYGKKTVHSELVKLNKDSKEVRKVEKKPKKKFSDWYELGDDGMVGIS